MSRRKRQFSNFCEVFLVLNLPLLPKPTARYASFTFYINSIFIAIILSSPQSPVLGFQPVCHIFSKIAGISRQWRRTLSQTTLKPRFACLKHIRSCTTRAGNNSSGHHHPDGDSLFLCLYLKGLFRRNSPTCSFPRLTHTNFFITLSLPVAATTTEKKTCPVIVIAGIVPHKVVKITARNFLFHPLGSLPAEGPGSEGVRLRWMFMGGVWVGIERMWKMERRRRAEF